MKKLLSGVLAAVVMCSVVQFAGAQASSPLDQKSLARIYKEVRHELVMLPFYGVFDNLSYKVDPNTGFPLSIQFQVELTAPNSFVFAPDLKPVPMECHANTSL